MQHYKIESSVKISGIHVFLESIQQDIQEFLESLHPQDQGLKRRNHVQGHCPLQNFKSVSLNSVAIENHFAKACYFTAALYSILPIAESCQCCSSYCEVAKFYLLSGKSCGYITFIQSCKEGMAYIQRDVTMNNSI